MYIGLRISDTLHKKPCRIGPGICATSENAPYAKFAELRKAEVQLPRIPIPRTTVNNDPAIHAIRLTLRHGAHDGSYLSLGQCIWTKGRTVISGVTLTTIFVSDLGAAGEFWTEKVGMPVAEANMPRRFNPPRFDRSSSEYVPPPVTKTHYIRLQPIGEVVIVLRQYGGVNFGLLPKDEYDHPLEEGVIHSLAVLVLCTDDLLAEYRQMNSRGVHFIYEPAYSHFQRQLIIAAFTDQDDNIIILEQQLEEGDPGPIGLEVAYEAEPF